MILIEHRIGLGQIVIGLGFLFPWQANEGFEVIAHHTRFCGHWRHQFKFLQLAIRLVTRFFRHIGGDDFFLKFLDVGTFFTFTEFFLNGFDLLVQIVFALAFFHLAFDTTTDAFFNLQDVDFNFHLMQHILEARLDAAQLE